MNLGIQHQRLLVRTFFAYFFAVSIAFADLANVPEELSVCFDFSCKSSKMVNLNVDEWQRVSSLFLLNSDADEERDRLKDAVAIMEQLMGLHTPTHRDVADHPQCVGGEPCGHCGTETGRGFDLTGRDTSATPR